VSLAASPVKLNALKAPQNMQRISVQNKKIHFGAWRRQCDIWHQVARLLQWKDHRAVSEETPQ
jgi:hypothetical protein